MKRWYLFAALLTAPLATACTTPISHVEVTPITEPPLEHEVSPERIAITHGTAMAVHVRVFDTDGDEDDRIVKAVADGSAFLAQRIEGDSTEGGRIVLYGSSPGTAELVVTSNLTDGEVRVPVEVLPQE